MDNFGFGHTIFFFQRQFMYSCRTEEYFAKLHSKLHGFPSELQKGHNNINRDKIIIIILELHHTRYLQ